MFSRGNFTGPILSHVPPPPPSSWTLRTSQVGIFLKCLVVGNSIYVTLQLPRCQKVSTISENLNLNEKVKYKMLNYFILN